MQGILEEDSHPARRIRISYTINHLGQAKLKSPGQTPVQRKIEVLSNVTFKELKEEIHKAINTIPREERFELVKTTLSRNDWDKYGLDNENCFIVFPIYPPRYGNTERSLRHDYGRNERELLHRILEEDSHPARRIRISYTINHLGQFQIQVLSIPALVQGQIEVPPGQTPVQRKIEVLSNVTFKELKEEIHKAINTIPREERFELVKTTLSRNDWDKYGLDNENCFIVFPIYPPRYGNTERSLRHDYGRNERELLHRILEEDSHPARRIRISYTINHLGQAKLKSPGQTPVQRKIEVLSNVTFKELKEEIHKAINTIPREERFELVKTTLSRNDWDKYGLDNENCFIVFPIYPPRYGNTERSLRHDYGRNERELLHRILEEDSHPARRIRISYTINHLGQAKLKSPGQTPVQRKIEVLSNVTFKELKEEIHKAINTIPREERFELVKTTLSRNDWDKYGLDNENCFIVFPIYPPRYGNTERSLRHDYGRNERELLHRILEEDSHPARRIRISYTINHLGQFQIQVLSIPALTSKPFNKTNIDILNYVQRTRQRIVDVPIIDNGGETSPVYVRDVWVDYADGIIRRFILSEGAVCIDPPVPRAYPQPRPQDLFDMITDATNENCFIVFPIYPPRYEEIDKLPSS
ncbi:hypothetical protein BLNAU_23949 [Blattamonas nauphoetae]|uniref:Uncharacterized protein n=1 Tax=Blattamonas nauphoetae TaxID=2049346 RepID=A0ABQ9WQT2_9EUKA|nr:hypothetical protein BLNAU_23949 [Blattamonas nauphoetae]